jgi:hypothetical protein
MMRHGQNIYITGTSQASPSLSTMTACLSQVQSIYSQHPEIHPAIVFEYLDLSKVLTVPQTATAFRRDPTMNVIIMMLWPGDEKLGNGSEVFKFAREQAKVCTRLVYETQAGKVTESQKLGYTNFGKTFFSPL